MQRKTLAVLIAVGLLTAGAVLAGCGSSYSRARKSSSSSSTTVTKNKRVKGSTETRLITGFTWQIISMQGSTGLDRVESSTSPTLELAKDNTMRAFGGINTVTGEWTGSDDGKLSIKPTVTTLMSGDSTLVAQEDTFLELLRQVTTFVVSPNGARLFMMDSKGAIIMEATTGQDQGLEGKVLTCRGYLENDINGFVSPVKNDKMTIDFMADRVKGTSGINSYTATYIIENDTLKFSKIVRTELPSTDDALVKQETYFYRALKDTVRYTYDQKVLSFYNAAGEVVLEFE